jgi:thiol-disulfide isomerase/thioredoxin
MKKLYGMVMILLAISAGSNAQSRASKYFTIKGTMENVADGAVIQLMRVDANAMAVTVTDTLKGGHFELRDTVSSVKKYYIHVSSEGYPINEILPVWVAPGKTIDVHAKDKLVPTWKVTSDIAEQMYQNGFQLSAYKDCQKHSLLNIQESPWIQKLYFDKKAVGKAEREAYRDSIRAIQKKEGVIDHRIDSLKLVYMKTAPLSKVWMLELSDFAKLYHVPSYNSFQPAIKALYQRMLPKQKQSPLGRRIASYIYSTVVKVGDHFVDGTLYDIHGNKHHLAEFSGQYILLDFWSRSCGPCVESLPEVAAVTEKYKNKLSVVSISQDTKEAWISYIQLKKMKGNQWNQLSSNHADLSTIYQIAGIPCYILISPEGKILEKVEGYGKGTVEALVGKYIK